MGSMYGQLSYGGAIRSVGSAIVGGLIMGRPAGGLQVRGAGAGAGCVWRVWCGGWGARSI